MRHCHIAACTDTEPTAEDSDSTQADTAQADTGKSSEDNQQKPSLGTPERQNMEAEHLAAAKKAIAAREVELNNLTTAQGVLESLRRAGVGAALVAEVTDKASKMCPR